ncbi:hypothetical protein [Baaleninema sp.]|uniref:hypothetical protein n=1 Tax=Baaleninema sp. TaxID=3101197 RepID=UPI003D01630B
MNATLEIHEFSTGIEVKPTANGWESGGFTGEYMNRTIDPIPKAVLDAIANREFALAEGSSIAVPALVGREVTGYGETWSVVAVVTRGTDDRGRGVSLYRYFLCRGEGYIEAILRWMGRQIRVFNPFETQAIGQPHQWQFSPTAVPLKPEFQQMLLDSPPIVVPATETCTPLILDRMTQELTKTGGRSWAYQVAALERPEYFQVMYPASPQAEAVFRQVLAIRPSSSVVVAGESAIKTAIKAITNGRVKRVHIETLENACSNPQVDEKYWNTLLNNQGASQALKEGMYDSRNVRLLTLNAMFVPKFLPDFLAWLHNSKKSEEHYKASLNLQESILKHFPKISEDCPQISERIKHGICIVVNRLVDKPQVLTESGFLLTSNKGLWSQVYRRSLYPQLENDLNLMRDHVYGKKDLGFQATKYGECSQFLGNLSQFWKLSGRRDSRYSTLAMLFAAAGTPKLAAICYQIAEGDVPKSVFLKVSANEWRSTLFGMTITRKLEFGDYVDLFLYETVDIGGIEMSRAVAGLILAIVLGLGFFGGFKIRDGKIHDLSKKAENYDRDIKSRDEEIQEWKDFVEQSNRTRQGLITLQNQLNEDLANFVENPNQNSEIQQESYTNAYTLFQYTLTKTLDIEGFNLNEIYTNKEKWDEFLEAVKKYQRDKFGTKNPDGIIDRGKETAKKLEEDIRKLLNPQTPE